MKRDPLQELRGLDPVSEADIARWKDTASIRRPLTDDVAVAGDHRWEPIQERGRRYRLYAGLAVATVLILAIPITLRQQSSVTVATRVETPDSTPQSITPQPRDTISAVETLEQFSRDILETRSRITVLEESPTILRLTTDPGGVVVDALLSWDSGRWYIRYFGPQRPGSGTDGQRSTVSSPVLVADGSDLLVQVANPPPATTRMVALLATDGRTARYAANVNVDQNLPITVRVRGEDLTMSQTVLVLFYDTDSNLLDVRGSPGRAMFAG